MRALLIALAAALAGAAAGVAAGGGAGLPTAATAANAHGKARHGMARRHCARWHVRGHRRVCVRRRPVHPVGAPGKGTQTTPGSGQTTTGGGTGTGGTGAGGTTTGGTTTTTTGPPPLPSRLAVDEYEVPSYRLHPSHDPVAAGTVQFNVYNFGMDPHTFAIRDAHGNQIGGIADVPANQPNTAVVVTADLAPGTYTLLCTLPNHAQLGMQATLTVQ